MVVEFESTTSEFVAPSPPAVLFQSDPSWLFINLTGVLYDVAPDDQHFLIGAVVQTTSGSTDDGPLPSVVLLNNFVEELKRRVGN